MADDIHDSFDSANPDAAARGRRGPPRPPSLAELPDRILEMLRRTPAGEVENQLRTGVNSLIGRLDLVTREEFEIQQAMVERLRERVEAIERQLNAHDGK